jgi:hypothetical protein
MLRPFCQKQLDFYSFTRALALQQAGRRPRGFRFTGLLFVPQWQR